MPPDNMQLHCSNRVLSSIPCACLLLRKSEYVAEPYWKAPVWLPFFRYDQSAKRRRPPQPGLSSDQGQAASRPNNGSSGGGGGTAAVTADSSEPYNVSSLKEEQRAAIKAFGPVLSAVGTASVELPRLLRQAAGPWLAPARREPQAGATSGRRRFAVSKATWVASLELDVWFAINGRCRLAQLSPCIMGLFSPHLDSIFYKIL